MSDHAGWCRLPGRAKTLLLALVTRSLDPVGTVPTRWVMSLKLAPDTVATTSAERRRAAEALMRRIGTCLVLGVLLVGCGTTDPAGPASGTTPAPSGAATSGLRGRVVAAPGCAVQRQGVPCPSLGLAAHIQVREAGSPEVVAEAVSNADGRFLVDLPAGSYSVTAIGDGGMPTTLTPPVVATVSAGRYLPIVLTLDSGIRGPALR